MRIDVAIARTPQRAAHVVDAQGRGEGRQLVDGEHPGVLDAERALVLHTCGEERDVVGGVAEARIAGAHEADLGLGRELVEGAAREDAQIDPQRVGVLRLDDADRQTGRAACELVALEHLDRYASRSQRIGDAAADDATADHNHARHGDRVVRAPVRRVPLTEAAILAYAQDMRDAVLFDIHGNIDALDAVLADVAEAGCEGLLLGGDYAYMGPAPDDCVDRLREHPGRVVAIRGNTDRMIANGDDAIAEWAADRLGDERVSWLGGLQPARVLPEHDAVIVHAVPGDDEWRLTPDTSDELAEARTADVGHATMLCGHVHLQYSRKVGEVEVVNPGSVGFPFDGDQRAAWAIIEDGQITLQRTAYDVERAMARLAGLASHPERALAERRLRSARS